MSIYPINPHSYLCIFLLTWRNIHGTKQLVVFVVFFVLLNSFNQVATHRHCSFIICRSKNPGPPSWWRIKQDIKHRPGSGLLRPRELVRRKTVAWLVNEVLLPFIVETINPAASDGQLIGASFLPSTMPGPTLQRTTNQEMSERDGRTYP
jgi:hypothetical protein